MKRLLLLGDTGKMGIALKSVFKDDYILICRNSKDFNAMNFEQVEALINESDPGVVINTVAFLGVESCEREPGKAFRLNALYPRLLAELSNKKGFLLIHFSTDSVFNDEKRDFYVESDVPNPSNVYGLTKYGGDCLVQAIAQNYYIFRASVLFGETNKDNQIIERMLKKVTDGETVLKISDDIVFSPSYSKDIAREIKRIVEYGYPFGLYHIANEGKVSLYDLMKEIIKELNVDVTLEKVSYKDFPLSCIRNTYSPIKSERIASLRPWKEAVKEYCSNLESNFKR